MTLLQKPSVPERARNFLAKFAWKIMSPTDLKSVNTSFVHLLRLTMPYKDAMEKAVGGNFDTVGELQLAILQHYGLSKTGYLVDVGCGSGRLAKPLSRWLEGRYLGIDLVPALIDYARKLVDRKDWTFRLIRNIEIPEANGQAEVVCFFSVFTHLLDEECFWYLEEAKRVLKPDGRIIVSFLELSDPDHFSVFLDTVDRAKRGAIGPINKFISRSSIDIWAQELNLKIVDVRSGTDIIAGGAPLGQSLFVLERNS
jgi:2-polyprenyl-3-methyl-5-hydroxy-6-metoxy-1,4-benzoquinol methylase